MSRVSSRALPSTVVCYPAHPTAASTPPPLTSPNSAYTHRWASPFPPAGRSGASQHLPTNRTSSLKTRNPKTMPPRENGNEMNKCVVIVASYLENPQWSIVESGLCTVVQPNEGDFYTQTRFGKLILQTHFQFNSNVVHNTACSRK